MVEYNRTRVYRKDWDFRVDDTEDYFVSDSTYVKNDDINESDEFDYMELEDFNLCRDLDDALYTLEFELEDILADRVYFENDKDNTVINEMAEAIRVDWREREDWTDAIDILAGIRKGDYDDEMKKYYAYLQAGATLENLYLYEINTSDPDELVEVLAGNNIYVSDDEVDFDLNYVRKSVERTDDLDEDVTKLLKNVLTELRDAGCYLDFTKYY